MVPSNTRFNRGSNPFKTPLAEINKKKRFVKLQKKYCKNRLNQYFGIQLLIWQLTWQIVRLFNLKNGQTFLIFFSWNLTNCYIHINNLFDCKNWLNNLNIQLSLTFTTSLKLYSDMFVDIFRQIKYTLLLFLVLILKGQKK